MVDAAVGLDDVDGAQPALAAAAVEKGVDSGVVQHVEQRAVGWHLQRKAMAWQADPERLVRRRTALAEGLESQVRSRPAADSGILIFVGLVSSPAFECESDGVA